MSFLHEKITHNIPYIHKKKYSSRKEQDSLLANHFPLILYKNKERASAFTSKGSITIEAAFVIPIFFFAMLCMVCLFEMMSIQTSMRNALYSTGKEFAEKAYGSPGITAYGVERRMIDNLGADKLDRSIIVGGSDGLDCSESSEKGQTGVLDLSVRYKIQIPILMFRIPAIACEETLRVKGWTGYAEGIEGEEKDKMVYITDYGLVYHAKMDCTYLNMSAELVSETEIENLRNASGAKYYPCESCGNDKGNIGGVYITTYGTRYHTSLDCKKVKRNVYAVPLEEVYGLGGCSKCVE